LHQLLLLLLLLACAQTQAAAVVLLNKPSCNLETPNTRLWTLFYPR
jgi:ankyrin repeat protein